MNDTYLQLLEFLEPWGIDREVMIEVQLYDWFTHQISVDPLEPFDSINARIERFLDVIHENRHITQARNKIRVEGKEDRWEVQVRLTYLGLEYLNQHRLTVSNILLNDTIRFNNKITWGIAIAAIVVSTGTSIWLGVSNNSLDTRVHQLEQALKKPTDKTKGTSYPHKPIGTPLRTGG